MNQLTKIILKIILGLFFYSVPFIILLTIAYVINNALFHINDDGIIILIPFLISIFIGIFLNNRYLGEVKKKFPRILIIIIQSIVAYISVGILFYTAFESLLVFFTLSGLR